MLSVLPALDVLSGLSAVALAKADVLSWAYRRPRLYMGTGVPCPPTAFLTTNHTEDTKWGLSRKNRYKKGGYLVCLTRGYTDGRTDSRPDKTDFIFISKKQVFC